MLFQHTLRSPQLRTETGQFGNFFLYEGGGSLTIESGATIGNRLNTDFVGSGSFRIDVSGDNISPGLDNLGNLDVDVNIRPGGVMTFDAVAPEFPNFGFFFGNVNAADGTFDVNIEGVLRTKDIDNAAVPSSSGTSYNLLQGGSIDMFGFDTGTLAGSLFAAGAAVGTRPTSSLDSFSTITVSGEATVVNAFNIRNASNFNSIPAGLTIDVSDQSTVGTDQAGWANYVSLVLGQDPTTIPSPLNFNFGQSTSSDVTGSGALQIDVYAIEVDDMGTPDPADDSLVALHKDLLNGGPSETSNPSLSFDGQFRFGYVGPEITTSMLNLLPGTEMIVWNAAAVEADLSQVAVNASVPDAIWNDGVNDYLVAFSGLFTSSGVTTSDLLRTSIESITLVDADFNEDGNVDAADYTLWRDRLGAAGELPYSIGDANGDGSVTADDYNIWNLTFSGLAEPSGIPAPEPASFALAVAFVALVGVTGRRCAVQYCVNEGHPRQQF